jgi:hypothetical protein
MDYGITHQIAGTEMQHTTFLLTTGLTSILGAFVYAIGDVLLLAGRISIHEYPKLRPHAKLLSSAERMVTLPLNRLMWGALLGVFVTPLVLMGYWQVYQGLQGGNEALALATTLLFTIASVIGGFVHGSFYYLGEYVHALNLASDETQPVIVDMIARHRKVMIVTYAPVLILIIIASILFSILVASGQTNFPTWMAAINPVTMTIVWLIVKRILPQFIRDWTEGAGFNIAYLVFFVCTTITLV